MDTETNNPRPNEVETESTTEEPKVMTAEEVAKLLRVNKKTVYAAFKQGEIPGGRRIGGTIRFSRERVLQWLADGQEHVSRSPRGAR